MTVASFLSYPAVYAAAAAVLAFAWAFLVATVVTRRVSPAVPSVAWWRASVGSALVTAGVTLLIHNPTASVIAAAVVPALLLSSYVDALTMRIPNFYSGLTALLVIFLGTAVSITVNPAIYVIASAAGIAVFIALLALNVVSRNGFGMGDVKFGAVIGTALTLIDAILLPRDLLHTTLGVTLLVLHLLVWMTVSFLLGGVYGTVRLVRKNRTPFPFGPFLAVGWLVAAVAAPAFVGLVTPYA